jgi:hypothetical protein
MTIYAWNFEKKVMLEKAFDFVNYSSFLLAAAAIIVALNVTP